MPHRADQCLVRCEMISDRGLTILVDGCHLCLPRTQPFPLEAGPIFELPVDDLLDEVGRLLQQRRERERRRRWVAVVPVEACYLMLSGRP